MRRHQGEGFKTTFHDDEKDQSFDGKRAEGGVREQRCRRSEKVSKDWDGGSIGLE